MSAMILIAAIVVFVMLFNSLIKSKRKVLYLKIRESYDRMEFTTLQKNIVLDNNVIEYLKCYKNLSVNPYLADIIIVAALLVDRSTDEIRMSSDKFKQLESKIPSELLEYGNRIDDYCLDLIRLSRWKPDFIIILFKVLFKKYSTNPIDKIKTLVKPEKEYAPTLSELDLKHLNIVG